MESLLISTQEPLEYMKLSTEKDTKKPFKCSSTWAAFTKQQETTWRPSLVTKCKWQLANSSIKKTTLQSANAFSTLALPTRRFRKLTSQFGLSSRLWRSLKARTKLISCRPRYTAAWRWTSTRSRTIRRLSSTINLLWRLSLSSIPISQLPLFRAATQTLGRFLFKWTDWRMPYTICSRNSR